MQRPCLRCVPLCFSHLSISNMSSSQISAFICLPSDMSLSQVSALDLVICLSPPQISYHVFICLPSDIPYKHFTCRSDFEMSQSYCPIFLAVSDPLLLLIAQRGSQRDVVTLSCLTNSALVYEHNCGGEGGGLGGLSQ
jgi:hypothetical protein